MVINFLDYGFKHTPRTSIQTDGPLKLQAGLGRGGMAFLFLLHKGERYAVSISSDLQAQYLFLEDSMVLEIYKEAIAGIQSEAARNPEELDINGILDRTIARHAPRLDQEAVRVNLQFSKKALYTREDVKYAAAAIRDRALWNRYNTEKWLLRRFIRQGSLQNSDGDAVQAILQGASAMSRYRLGRGYRGSAMNREQFENWVRELLEPDGAVYLVRYCRDPEGRLNNIFEGLLCILLHNCPDGGAFTD